VKRQNQYILQHPASGVGVDVGRARLSTLSDGTIIEAINRYKKQQARLARYLRAMSRKTKYRRNWKKANVDVTKLHPKIGNIRSDYPHKTRTTITIRQNDAMVCLESSQPYAQAMNI
jgi:putative transposase